VARATGAAAAATPGTHGADDYENREAMRLAAVTRGTGAAAAANAPGTHAADDYENQEAIRLAYVQCHPSCNNFDIALRIIQIPSVPPPSLQASMPLPVVASVWSVQRLYFVLHWCQRLIRFHLADAEG